MARERHDRARIGYLATWTERTPVPDAEMRESLMAEAGDHLHEDPTALSATTRDRHRANVSLREELEAIDWYDQRAEATLDPNLAETLLHNRNEEAEHAAMLLEWLRRSDPVLDRHLRTYLFTVGSILEIEEDAE
jgi:ferritin-like protein